MPAWQVNVEPVNLSTKINLKYKHLFFDLDHTIWDFETNSRETILELYTRHGLFESIHPNFDEFFERYSYHNKRLWDRYHHGFIKQDELRWKRMWHALLEFKVGDEKLAKQLSQEYLEILPTKKALFPYAIEVIKYLTAKDYQLHLITNGFDEVQWGKIRSCEIDQYFKEVITSEKAMSLKPQPEIFEYALNITGAKKKKAS